MKLQLNCYYCNELLLNFKKRVFLRFGIKIYNSIALTLTSNLKNVYASL